MKKQTIEVYEFSELGKEAKEKARDEFRQSCLDYDWWDFIYEGIIEKAEEYGITLEDKDIQFTGFWSQGDGASFISKEINNYKFAEKAGIKVDKKVLDTIELYIDRTIMNYSHMNSVHATAVYNDLPSKYEKKAEELTDKLEEVKNMLCTELYSNLENYYNELLSDEHVDEDIIANEYEFLKDGTRF